MTDMPNDPTRRDLLKGAALVGAGLALGLPDVARADGAPVPLTPIALPQPSSSAATMLGVPFDRHAVVRVAIVGTGLRGRSVLHELLGVDNVRITALCDTAPEKMDMAVKQMRDAGHTNEPARFTGSERSYEQLVQRDDIDLVYTATPWQFHVPICLAAMKAGKHVATEVPAAYTIEECWKLVDASEKSRRHCIMMENCSYGYNELLVLNMVRAGVFGEIKHGGAAYNHDLREILFENRDEGLWRRAHHTLRNANLYPTHGLGPVAAMMNINRGDKFDYLVAMSTPEMGLTRWREDHEPKDSPTWAETYVTGDLSVSLIKTAKGCTIRLEHDVSSPRPYSRINSVQGSKGIFEDYPARVYVEATVCRIAGRRWMVTRRSTSTRSGANLARKRAPAAMAAWTT
jgi:Oxidoreductase family, NAD-binding Rossmann fold/TAT (twin-arginine translocation) pathway signal sequence